MNSRELIWQLFKRDFLGAYKKSFLGVAWAVLTPLAATLSWAILQHTGVIQPGQVGVPYFVYVLVGSSFWTLFQGSYRAAANTLKGSMSLITQVNYPHEAVLIKELIQTIATFVIVFVLNVGVMIAFGVFPGLSIVFLPLVVIPLVLLGSAIGLIVSMIAVIAADVINLLDVALSILMYLTPIVYAAGQSNALLNRIAFWNPLSYLVCSPRDLLLFGRLYDNTGFAICALGSVVAFLVSWRLFYVSEQRVIERLV